MFRPFYAFIGYRYTHIKRKNHFISFISLTSVIGVALGVGVLIAVLSVMNGFNREIRAQMLSGTPHITVGRIGQSLIDYPALIKTLKENPKVLGAAPYVASQGMISNATTGQVNGVMVQGIDPNAINDVYPLGDHLLQGKLSELKAGEFGIIIGKPLAHYFGLVLGDKVSLITPEASVTPAGLLPRIKRFTIIGIFEIGDLYDDKEVFINISDASKLFRLQDGVTGVQIKVQDELDAPVIARDIYLNLKMDYWVSDWTQTFGSFFRALKIQKITFSFIFLLIIAVAAFNLVSSLVMMVTDKRNDIAILRTLGASRRTIMGIFIAQGSLIGTIGTVLGVLLGYFLALNVTGWTSKLQKALDVELVAKDVYLVNFLPSEVHTIDVVTITIVTLIMCFVATLYPAWRAASIQPAEALRYE